MDLVFKTYAELKLRCHGLSTWLRAGVAQLGAVEDRYDCRAGVELIEQRLMMSNSAPVLTVPASAATDENVSLVFSSAHSNVVSVTDSSAGSNADNVTLTVNHGTLTLTSSTGLTFTTGAVSGSSSLAFSGTIASINNSLAGMQFVPTSGYTGSATMQFAVTDPGDSTSASASTTITVSADPVAVNDPNYKYNENQTLTVAAPGVLANDSDSNGQTFSAVQVTSTVDGRLDWNPSGLGQFNVLTAVSTLSSQPTWSPDGTRLAYTSAASGTYQIYVMNADGTGVVQLTNAGETNIQPAWSPDGTKIAFYSDRTGTPQIWVMNADGSNLVQLTSNSAINGQPVWSPDGTKICFSSNVGGNYELYLMSSTGTGLTQLTTLSGKNASPSWSPDGTKIAFSSSGTGTAQIWEVNPDGTGLTRITDNSDNDTRPTWNPTSDRIAFMSDRSGTNALYVMNSDGTDQLELTGNAGTEDFPNWSVDGTKIALLSNGQVVTASVLTDGGFKYIPNTGSTATDSFTYEAFDGVATSNAATVTLTRNQPPTVATAAAASPNPVTGTTTALSVTGADDGGASNLLYTWATTGTPPAEVTFSANGTDAAKDTTATFTKAGTYNFQATITDAGGLTVTSSVSVVVDQKLSQIVVLPSLASLAEGSTQQCTATGYDQFDDAIATTPTYTWSVSGGGSINQSGLYTAPSASGDYPIIKVTSGSCIGLAQLTTVANSGDVSPPGANTGSSASVNVAGYSTSYIYNWSILSAPAGAPAPTFSANTTSAAYETVVTFYQAGLYEYVCNFGAADGSGTRYCASFESTIEQTTTTVSVSPTSAALHENGTQSFTAIAADQFGNAMSPEPAFTWAKASGVGSINSSGLYTAPNGTGSASVTATSGSVVASASITVTNAPPTVATPAAASPSPVTGTTAALSVLGADDGGESNLSYTWATTGTPPAAVTFSSNGTHGAQNTTATFTKAGSYTFQVTIKDAGGLSTTSLVSVTVKQTVKNITISPNTASLNENQTQQFNTSESDQFGAAITSLPTINWAVASGVGSISSSGLYTAPYGAGSATVTATSGSASKSATVSVTNAAPTVATAATASPSPVTGTTTVLSALGADDGGESNLTYTWATTGIPPAAVSFSANGTNAAKNTTATFTKYGTYTFQVTITDAGELSTTSSVTVAVDQTLKTIVVSPSAAPINENQTQQFAAAGDDQFGNAMSVAPTFTWSRASGIGSISTSGLYAAPASAGMATITATSGSVTGTASVTVSAVPPTVATAAAASPNPVSGTTTALSVLGADDNGESSLTYTWAITGTPPAAVAFSANGINAAKNTTATFSKAGTYIFQVTLTDTAGLSTTSSVSVTVNQALTAIVVSPATVTLNENQTEQFTATAEDQFGNAMSTQPTLGWSKASGVGSISLTGLYTAPNGTGSASVTALSGIVSGSSTITVANAPPTVGTAAAATPNPVSGTTTALSVLGADDGGESNLSYTWATTGTPPAAVTFSANGTNAAKSTTATFAKAGTYHFRVTITDAGGLSTTSSVSVTVNQTLETMTVTPATAPLNENQLQQFAATGLDQFGDAMSSQPTVTWSKSSGVGSINVDGLYTAPYGTGLATITASSGSVSASASIAVTNAAPAVAAAAAASPNPVTGTTAALSVLGADDGGESNLTYTWTTTGLPPAAVTFSANGANAAKSTTATFTTPGTYTFQATITDAGGLSTTSSVSVTVNQTLSMITVSPPSSSLHENDTEQLTAAGFDQFGNAMMVAPTFTWSKASGVGTISSSGFYTSPASAGSASITASSGTVIGSASITVINAAPTVATAAAANPGTVTGTSTALSVLGADDGGESNLTYSWSVLSKPSSAPVPSFSTNGSNAAKNTTATFGRAGNYTLEATITDAGGLSTSSSVSVTVDQTFSSIVVSPQNNTLATLTIQQFSATALDQFGQSLATQPTFTWAATDGVILPGGLFTSAAIAGPATITATSGNISGSANETTTGSNTAEASPSTVTGTTTTLSVSDGATIGVTYSWSVLSQPSGAASPTFSVNGSSAAQTTTATFFAAGDYTFQVAIAAGATTTQTVDVIVDQNLSTIDVAPNTSNLNENGKQAFSAVGFDQFDKAMLAQPDFSWSVASGGGTIDGSGAYTAAGSGGAGSATISATSQSLEGASIVGWANVNVTNAAPTISSFAAASPTSVSGTTALLSVLAADDGGESNLTYTWSTIGTPPAPVSFNANGSNAAKDTTATFTSAGAYQFLATARDAEGLSVTSSVNVTVYQTLASLALSPAAANVSEGNSQQITATATDQFGNSMPTPSLLWSVPSGTGSVSSSGLYTAASTSGITTVQASSGTIRATATLTVPNEPPTVASVATASPGLIAGTSTALSVLGADDGGESNLTYTWSTTGPSPAPVEFSANASNVAENTTANFTQSGDYQFLVTITDAQGLSTTSTTSVTVIQTLTGLAISPESATVTEGHSDQFSATATDQFGNLMPTPSITWSVRSGAGSIDSAGLYTAPGSSGNTIVSASNGSVRATAMITVPNEPPTVAIAAAPSANPVTGTSTALSVLGTDDGGEPHLFYTWSTAGAPPAPVLFSANDSNAASSTTATFTKAGDYQFIVTITDAQGLAVTSSASVTVTQTLAGIALSPPSATVAEGASHLFSAAAVDQFGNPMLPPPLAWAVVSGGGTIDNTGLYTAGTTSGSVTVSGSSGNVSGQATITVPNQPPAVATAAAASPSPVIGNSTALSVLGADDNGEANLTYTWSAIGTPPAPVVFSANGTNGAQNATATFSAAGNYDLLATITDAQGATANSSVRIEVVPLLSAVTVSPADAATGRGQTVQFSATAVDQFGAVLANQPEVAWSIIGDEGSVDSSGVFTAPTAGNGAVTVIATATNASGERVGGTASVNLVDGLSASVPAFVSASPGVPVVFNGGTAITLNDRYPGTASVPVSITVSATHGTVSLSSTAGLNFLNGTENNGALLTFSGNIADVDKALRGMAYTSEAGFAGEASLTITINETGVGHPLPSYPIAIEVATPPVSLSSGGSGTISNGASSLSNVLDTSSITEPTVSPSNYSNTVVVNSTPFGDSVIEAATSTPAATPTPTPTPTPANSVSHATPNPAQAPAKANEATPKAAPVAPTPSGNGNGTGYGLPGTSAGAVADVRVESVPEQVFPFLAAKGEMARQLDAADDQLVADRKVKIVAGSATVASVGASAAYVLWMLRGGSLLSSLLSILPAWQSIDPLPVLDNFESSKRRKRRMNSDAESLESIESMVDKSNSASEHGPEHDPEHDGEKDGENGPESATQQSQKTP